MEDLAPQFVMKLSASLPCFFSLTFPRSTSNSADEEESWRKEEGVDGEGAARSVGPHFQFYLSQGTVSSLLLDQQGMFGSCEERGCLEGPLHSGPAG